MTHYTTGRKTEYRAIKFLSSKGYEVTRSAGSKGVFDLIACDNEIVRFVQVKYTSDEKRSFSKELDSIKEFESPLGTTKELWIYQKFLGWSKIYFISGYYEGIDYPEKAEVYVTE